jgi:hypothetical protein
MGSGVSKQQQQAAKSKRLVAHASTSGITDPRVLLGTNCSPKLAELSEAVMDCCTRSKWVCLKMSLEHSRDIARVTQVLDLQSRAAVMKDRILIAKNLAHNFTQAVIWGDQADFVSATHHRRPPDSIQFKLNFQGALQRSYEKKRHDQGQFGALMTVKQKPASVHGRFPVCAHYWWKSEDLMAIILNNIPMAQLGKVSLVHRIWHAASKKISSIILTQPITGDRLLEAQHYYHNPVCVEVASMYNVHPGVWFSFFSYASRNFKQLTSLTLKNCSSVVDDDLVPICEHCVSLQSLSLVSLAGLLRPKITSITLNNLSIEDCAWFEELVGFIPCITHVSLVRLNCMHGAGFDRTCIVIGIIDDKNSESKLKSFTLRQCNGTTDLVIKNQCIETIRVIVCGSLVSCTIIANNATLLAISQCFTLSSIDITMPLLDQIVIQDMISLTKAEITCPHAEHITFQDINSTKIPVLQHAMKHFKSLKSCRIANVGSASQLPFGPDFPCFRAVTTMFISNCAFNDSSLAVLSQFESLKQFELWDCAALTCPHFDFFVSLKNFACHSCINLFSFEIHAPGMTEFLISKCHALKELNIHSMQLKSVGIHLCEKISAFHVESESLTELELENIHRIEKFSCELPALQNVNIKYAHEQPHATMMQALFKSKNITTISFEDLSGFSSFHIYQLQPQWDVVRNLNLQHLALQDNACEFLERMSGLVRLNIRNCNSFHRIKLVGLSKLKTLRIDDCSNLTETIVNAPKIENVLIQNCKRLLSAMLSGRSLVAASFRKNDSIFMISSADGCPSLKTIFFSNLIDVHTVRKAFCNAPELAVQIGSHSHLIIMGELQMRHVLGET